MGTTTRIPRNDATVNPSRVATPDFDNCTVDRLTGVDICDIDIQMQLNTLFFFGQVGPNILATDIYAYALEAGIKVAEAATLEDLVISSGHR